MEPLVQPYFDRPMLEDFAASVEQDREPVCGAKAGYWTQAVADAARDRTATGRRKAERGDRRG